MTRSFTQFIQLIFYPLMVVIGLTMAVVLVHTLDEKYYNLIPVFQLLFFVPAFLICEKYWPYREEWTKQQGDTVNDYVQTFVVFTAALKASEFLIPLLFYFPVLWLAESFGPRGMLHDMNMGLAFFISLMACEFCFYWFHRAVHRFRPFWRFHAVHHGATRIYWGNSARFHFLESLAGCTMYFFPLLLLNVTPQVAILVIAFSSVTGFMEHININFKAGIFNYIFNTAELHRWHHSTVMNESNRNFGKAFVFYDMIFGTYYNPRNREVGPVGINGVDVPVKFMGQLKHPFIKSK